MAHTVGTRTIMSQRKRAWWNSHPEAKERLILRNRQQSRAICIKRNQKYGCPMSNPLTVAKAVKTNRLNGTYERNSKRMKNKNPMQDNISVEKMKATSFSKGIYQQSAIQMRQKWVHGILKPHSMSRECREKISSIMTRQNPMKNNASVEKMKKTCLEKGVYKETSKQLKTRWKNDASYVAAVINTARNKTSRGQEQLVKLCEVLGYNFEVNYYVHKPDGHGFLLDVALVEQMKEIEYDGHSSHYTDEGRKRDNGRDQILRSLGWQILRIGNREIFSNYAINKIRTFVEAD